MTYDTINSVVGSERIVVLSSLFGWSLSVRAMALVEGGQRWTVLLGRIVPPSLDVSRTGLPPSQPEPGTSGTVALMMITRGRIAFRPSPQVTNGYRLTAKIGGMTGTSRGGK